MSKIEIEHETTIERPPEEVYAFVTDPQRAPEWRVGLLEAKLLTEGPMRAGTVIEEIVQVLGRRLATRVEVIALEPGRGRTLRVRLGPLPIVLRERYEPVEGGTRLTVTGTTEVTGVQRLAARAALAQVRRQLEQELAAIRALLEG